MGGFSTTTTCFDLSGFHFTDREEAMTKYSGFSFWLDVIAYQFLGVFSTTSTGFDLSGFHFNLTTGFDLSGFNLIVT